MSFGFGILYPAPTMDGAIFNEYDFTSFGSTNLTYDQAKNYFVTYPISQGGEQTFLGDLNVAGELYADGGATIGSVSTNTSFEQTSNTLTITNNFSGTNQIDFQTTNLSWNGVTLGTGGGDVLLSATQTFTGVNTFNNAGGIVMTNSPSTATTTSIFQFTDNNCHFSSSVIGGGLRIQDPNVGATLAVNSNGLTINKGLQLGNTSGSNIVQMVADATTNNQLNITGNLSVSNNLIFPNSSSLIELNDTLQFQNSNSPSYPIQLRNTSNVEWYLEPTTNPTNFHLNFGGMSIDADAYFINLSATSSVRVGNILTIPNNPNIDPTALGSGNGTFYVSSQLPYFDYNNSGVITSYPLVVSSTLSNYAVLTTGTNNFSNTNTFSFAPTTSATQTYPQTTNTTDLSTIGYVNSAVAGVPNTGVPIGTIQMWGGNTFAPTGYVFCSGQSYSTTGTFASLFAVLGYTYGGSGANFNVPAFHNGNYGVMPIGAQFTYGAPIGVVQSGGEIGTTYPLQTYNGDGSYITANQVAPHDHTIAPPQSQYCYGNNNNNVTTGGSSSRVSGNVYATQPIQTTGMTNFNPSVPSQLQAQYYPPYCAVMFIIKYI